MYCPGTPVERVRTRRRVFDRLVQYAEELKDEGRDAWVVQHIRDPENAQRLVERCREVMGSENRPAEAQEIAKMTKVICRWYR